MFEKLKFDTISTIPIQQYYLYYQETQFWPETGWRKHQLYFEKVKGTYWHLVHLSFTSTLYLAKRICLPYTSADLSPSPIPAKLSWKKDFNNHYYYYYYRIFIEDKTFQWKITLLSICVLNNVYMYVSEWIKNKQIYWQYYIWIIKTKECCLEIKEMSCIKR